MTTLSRGEKVKLIKICSGDERPGSLQKETKWYAEMIAGRQYQKTWHKYGLKHALALLKEGEDFLPFLKQQSKYVDEHYPSSRYPPPVHTHTQLYKGTRIEDRKHIDIQRWNEHNGILVTVCTNYSRYIRLNVILLSLVTCGNPTLVSYRMKHCIHQSQRWPKKILKPTILHSTITSSNSVLLSTYFKLPTHTWRRNMSTYTYFTETIKTLDLYVYTTQLV